MLLISQSHNRWALDAMLDFAMAYGCATADQVSLAVHGTRNGLSAPRTVNQLQFLLFIGGPGVTVRGNVNYPARRLFVADCANVSQTERRPTNCRPVPSTCIKFLS